MSGKLGQSLDEILKDQRATRGRGRPARRGGKPATKAAAPAGGIKKNTKPAGKAAKQAPAPNKGGRGGVVLQLGNMPKDVSEKLIKDFIVELNKDKSHPRIGAVQSVKRISDKDAPRSIWQIRFVESDAAYRAVSRLDGLDIDRKPIQAQLVLSGDAIPDPPTLSSRITSAPKSAAATKSVAKNAKGAAIGKAAPGKKGRGGKPKNARPAKKSAEELDAEMADYFDPSKAAAEANGAAPTNGDAQMEDEIL